MSKNNYRTSHIKCDNCDGNHSIDKCWRKSTFKQIKKKSLKSPRSQKSLKLQTSPKTSKTSKLLNPSHSSNTKINRKMPTSKPGKLKLHKWEFNHDNKKYIIREYGYSPADAIGNILDIFEGKKPYDFSKIFIEYSLDKISKELVYEIFNKIMPTIE